MEMASETTFATMQERLGGAAALAGIVETFYAVSPERSRARAGLRAR